MKKKLIFSIISGFALFAMTSASFAAKYANPGLLLDAKQVKANISKADWVVVDCRPLKKYSKGHIPGAISLGKRCDKALRDATARMFTSVEKYEKILGKVGIGNDTHVVFYHGNIKTLTRATVGFWVMEVLGHKDAHLLNGGLEAWKAAGFKLDSKPTMKKATTFKANRVASRYATTEEILTIARGEEKNTQLIDSRTEGEYKGKKIFYSLGNFLFDQYFSEGTKTLGLLEVEIQGKKIISTNLKSGKINSHFQVTPPEE